jgi:hypothetical protein
MINPAAKTYKRPANKRHTNIVSKALKETVTVLVTNTPAKKNVSNAIAQVKTLQMLPK